LHFSPGDAEIHLAIASTWRRQWLRTLDRDALERAIAQADTASRLRPGGSDAWLRLVPLLYEHGDRARAGVAAARAIAGRPRRVEALLAGAYTAFRDGEIERADSLFEDAIPRLAPDLRALFEARGRAGAAADADTAGTPRVPARRTLVDPDPTTPPNEVLLEYWSRVAHAYLLFADPLLPGLDARAETYLRYGPPARVSLNPAGVPLSFKPNVIAGGRQASLAEYPLDAQVWDYPELGMRVVLNDRSLTGRYTQPADRDFRPGSVPDPVVLARRGDLLSTDGDFAVFPTLPPREQRLDVGGVLAGFEAGAGPRLFAQVQAPGDSLTARWVVLDSTGHEVRRGARELGLSICDPGARRTGDFVADLPPGRYDVTVSVRDGRRRRGLHRETVTLAPVSGDLALSDLVLCCGDPSLLSNASSIRLEANIERRVTGRAPLVAYFEIYHLATEESRSRITFDWTVQRLVTDRRGRVSRAVVATNASREDEQAGTMRRQFLTVPIASLPQGRYRLEVVVYDRIAGTRAQRSLEFARE